MKKTLLVSIILFAARLAAQPSPPSAGALTVDRTTGAIVAPVSAATFAAGNGFTVAPFPNSFLANSTITIAGHSVALGGSQTLSASDLTDGTTGSGSIVLGTSPTLTTPSIASIVNTGTLTLPTSTDTLVGRATTDTLTNKSISGAANTLSAIPGGALNAASVANAALANSTITIAGTSTALGGSITQDTITGLASTGLVKRTGANALAIAASGTDYLAPTGSGAGLTGIVTTLSGTAGQVTASSSTGAVTLSLPTAITGVNSVTAASGQGWTAQGGDNGASLTLGQGTSAPTATISATGTGTNAEQSVLTVAASTSGTPTVGYGPSLRFFRKGNDGGTSGSSAGLRASSVAGTGSNQYDANLVLMARAGGGMVDVATATNTGNLLIGGTTDISGSGGLKVFGTTAATSTTTGSLINAGGFGNAGAAFIGGTLAVSGTGASSFAGPITLNNTSVALLTLNSTAASGKTWLMQSYSDGKWYLTHSGVKDAIIASPTTGDITLGGNLTVSGTGTSSFAGKVNFPASTTAASSINLPHGAAPTSPTNGDLWTTTGGLYARINGATVGPFGAGGGGGTTITTATVTSQFDKTTDTVLADVPGLLIPVTSGNNYVFHAVLFVTAGSSGGVQAAINGPSMTTIAYNGTTNNGTGSLASANATAVGTAVGKQTSSSVRMVISGTCTPSASGNITIQFAQNASNGTPSSVLVGSFMEAHTY